MRAKFAIELIVLSALALLLIIPACREENPPLDRNKAPETFLTSSPTETTATDYRVHMYWHSADDDGVVNRYIWYISDTLLTLDPVHNADAEGLDWNPSERIADYLKGRFISKTDTVFIFKGYDDQKLAQINRQAFHIASIDDGGKIDPSPARLQFFARVKGIPTVRFWTVIGGTEKDYNQNALDTISMFVPFSVRFLASTVNNVITGYRWSYSGEVFPDYNNDGNPDWAIPANQTDKLTVSLPNSGSEVLPSGVFNFKVIARDEAGALSKSDIISGVGVCRVVVNHDPDTEIKYGRCFFTPQRSGVPESLDVDFSDGIPDTLPYNARLRMSYQGWDHPLDRGNLQYNPPLPIRFQFGYNRWSYDEYGATVADKVSPWYPLKTPEDTNPNAGQEVAGRDIDSTTMRVGTFNYRFFVRSFDEQNRPDGTPPEVRFIGNFPPKLDSVRIGFINQVTKQFVPATNDTLFVGWKCLPLSSCGNKIAPHAVQLSADRKSLTKSFKFVIRAGGHDDRRDPPGSGIKGWRYSVTDPEQDLTYSKEGEWMFDKTLNLLEQECSFSITVPFKQGDTLYLNQIQPDSLVANPPLFFGEQAVTVAGMDISDKETFLEGIRGVSPKFEYNETTQEWDRLDGGSWITNEYYFANYSRRDSYRGKVILKLVK